MVSAALLFSGAAIAVSDIRAEAAEAPANNGYLTILWGRSNWSVGSHPNCTLVIGAQTLEQNAQDLKARGLRGVGGVVTDRVSGNGETRQCISNQTVQTSWQDLDNLRKNYGWQFISQSKSYADLTTLSSTQLYNETAGTIITMKGRGHTESWGAFSPPDGATNPSIQGLVAKYFAFNRVYGNSGVNTKPVSKVFPYPMYTFPVTGGRCNDNTLPCYNLSSTTRRTMSPHKLANVMSAAPDEWRVIQFYRLVSGAYGSQGKSDAWDCTSTDWRERWTGAPEVYCRTTFLEALDMRTNKSAKSVDPQDMAYLWNRFPDIYPFP